MGNVFIIKERIFIISIFLVLFSTLHAQDNYLLITGQTERNMKPLSGATVTLYEGSNKIKSQVTGEKGEFEFKLDLNKEYTIKVSKKNFVSKRIKFVTKVPEDVSGVWKRGFAMGLFPVCEGVDYSILDNPVDVVTYDTKKGDFESDKNYARNMRGKIINVMMNTEKCEADKYNNLIKEADRLLKEKNYEAAREKYEQAAFSNPDDYYPTDKIDEIDKIIKQSAGVNELFKQTVSEADNLMAQQNYELAKTKYQGASRLRPNDPYPKQKIQEIENLLAKQGAQQAAAEAKDREYNNLIVSANNAYMAKNYEQAKSLYQQALEKKPGESFPAGRIQEVDQMLGRMAQQNAQQKTTDNAYQQAISQADAYMQQGKHGMAMEYYNKALQIKPNESYPKNKITQINNIKEQEKQALAMAKQEEIDKLYKAKLAEANQYITAKNYEAAINSLNEAKTIKPSETQPMAKINQVNQLIEQEKQTRDNAKRAELDRQFNLKIAQADQYVAAKNYEAAINTLNQALTIKPNETLPRTKISQINQMIERDKVAAQRAKQAEIDRNYNAKVAEGDRYVIQKNYDAAIKAFNEALLIKPNELYPKQKLGQIDNIMAAEDARKKRELEERYKIAMDAGERFFSMKNYEMAVDKFQQALTIKPNDTYAQNRINEANRLILADKQKQQQLQAQKNEYNTHIAQADRLFASKDYTGAKTLYEKAQRLFPTEAYPRQKIAEINLIEEQQRKALANKQAKENAYNLAISKADRYMQMKDYTSAQTEYKNALAIKPNETYPNTKLQEITRILEEQSRLLAEKEAREQAFQDAVRAGDMFFQQQNFTAAKSKYTEALTYNSAASHPKQQIAKIDKILADAAQKELEEKVREEKFNSLVTQGDNAFTGARYNEAKELYQEALAMKPNTDILKQKIKRIEDIQRKLAQQSQKTPQTTQPKPAPSKLEDLSGKSKSEMQAYLGNLKRKYPAGVTHEEYKERNQTTSRFVVIRGDEVREFRKIQYSWGQQEFFMNGKPITSQYFNTQTRVREGEYYKKISM